MSDPKKNNDNDVPEEEVVATKTPEEKASIALRRANRRKNPVVRFFTTRPVPKVLSLIGAILLFFYVVYQKQDTRELSVPLRIENLPKTLGNVEKLPSHVTLVLRGDREKLFALETKGLEAYVDLSRAKLGRDEYPVRLNDETPGLHYSLKPAQIDVILGTVSTNWVKVTPKFLNKLPEGFRLAKYSVDPMKVEITGTSNNLRRYNTISTEPIYLNKIRKDVERSVQLLPLENVTVLYQNSVKIVLDLEVEMDTQVFTKISPTIVGLKKGFLLQNRDGLLVKQLVIERLTVRGTAAAMRTLSLYDIVVRLDVSDITAPGEYTRAPSINVKAKGVEVVSVVPTRLTFTVVAASPAEAATEEEADGEEKPLATEFYRIENNDKGRDTTPVTTNTQGITPHGTIAPKDETNTATDTNE